MLATTLKQNVHPHCSEADMKSRITKENQTVRKNHEPASIADVLAKMDWLQQGSEYSEAALRKAV